MVTEIQLNGDFKAVVDDADLDALLEAGTWTASKCDNKVYARRQFLIGAHSVTVSMHTFLTGWRLVDHINGDGLDNRRSNLRPATPSQNLQNTRRPVSNSSGYKGVGFHKASGRWRAYIGIQGRQTSLGYHESPEAAARAYDAAAIEHFGEFARLNFPTKGE